MNLMMLLLFLLGKVIIEFIFGIWAKTILSIWWNSDLNEKRGLLQFFFVKIKMSDRTTYYQKSKNKILKRAKEKDENNRNIARTIKI